jgi:hypothetical protein
MKNTLWMIIALVTGIVGFLVGYSVSGFTGARRAAEVAAHAAPAQDAHKADAGGYAGAGAPAHKAEAGGYGAAAAPARPAEAGGYGAAQPAAAGHPQKVPADKPKAAGY